MKVKLINGPSGPGCRHIHVTELNGKLIDVFMRDDLGQDDQEGEPPMRRRIKFLVKRFLRQNPTATVEQIRAYIEGEEL